MTAMTMTQKMPLGRSVNEPWGMEETDEENEKNLNFPSGSLKTEALLIIVYKLNIRQLCFRSS